MSQRLKIKESLLDFYLNIKKLPNLVLSIFIKSVHENAINLRVLHILYNVLLSMVH